MKESLRQKVGKGPPGPLHKWVRPPVGTLGLPLAEDQPAFRMIEICGEKTSVRSEAEGKETLPQSRREGHAGYTGRWGGGAQGTAPPTVRGPPPSAQITKLGGVRL